MLNIKLIMAVLALSTQMGTEACSRSKDLHLPQAETLAGVISDELAGEGCAWIIVVVDDSDTARYEPMDLAGDFQKDGLRVEAEYTLSRAPENCAGVQPILITSIKTVE